MGVSARCPLDVSRYKICIPFRHQPMPTRNGYKSAFGARKGEETLIEDCPFIAREMFTHWIKFTRPHRSTDKELHNVCDFILEHNKLPQLNREAGVSDLFQSSKPSVICWTNKTRKRINQEFANQFEYGASLPPLENPSKYASDKIQPFIFQVGMPIVCITTEAASKRKIAGTDDVRQPKYANNDWGVIKAFENGIVTVVIEENDIIQFTLG